MRILPGYKYSVRFKCLYCLATSTLYALNAYFAWLQVLRTKPLESHAIKTVALTLKDLIL